jgi:hypothetical protein
MAGAENDVGKVAFMDELVLSGHINYLCDTSGRELYRLALYLFGSESDALKASAAAFTKAFQKVSGGNAGPDMEKLEALGVRFLYRYGKAAGAGAARGDTALHNALCRLTFDERFVLLLFCCRKMKLRQIAAVLRRPHFLVARRLLSGARKLAP